ncbi:MAG: hypothetical protein AAGD34_03810 [Pseudomonadota bacterium]
MSADAEAAPETKKKKGVDVGLLAAIILGNITLIVLVLTFVIGIDVAFYAALAATPIWIVIMMIMAVDGANPGNAVPTRDELD